MPFWNLSCYQKVLPHIPPHPPTSGVGLRTSVEVIRTVLGGNSNLRHADIGTSQWIFTKCFWIVDSVLCAFYILIHWILPAVPWCKGWYCYLHVLKKEGGSLPAGVCSLSAFGWFSLCCSQASFLGLLFLFCPGHLSPAALLWQKWFPQPPPQWVFATIWKVLLLRKEPRASRNQGWPQLKLWGPRIFDLGANPMGDVVRTHKLLWGFCQWRGEEGTRAKQSTKREWILRVFTEHSQTMLFQTIKWLHSWNKGLDPLS